MSKNACEKYKNFVECENLFRLQTGKNCVVGGGRTVFGTPAVV